jgi:solute:Na+ symporter, SSS family
MLRDMLAASSVRLDTNALDFAILGVYFVVVLGIGFIAKRYIRTSLDYFLSGRSLPAWITGLAFVSANLGATEILGQGANGAQYGVATVNYYWIGAVPAMVFLGLVMMPFYYGSRVRSVPEYLLMRFDKRSHLFNSYTFALATVLIAGVNLFALALVLKLLLGWAIITGILVAAIIVLIYITLGGLSSAIYNEVLQFFVILAALIPLTIVGLHDAGGWSGLKDHIRDSKLGEAGLHALQGTDPGHVTNPIGATWIGIVFGLGFVLSFGYWTTNFVEVQRAMASSSISAAQRAPIIGSFPKMFIPFIVILPGMIAGVVVNELAPSAKSPNYNNALLYLMRDLLPNGMLGVAIAGLLASFMAGMAANISAFNTVWSYDLWQTYVVKDREDSYYTMVGRVATLAATLIAIGTAVFASNYTNIMNYLQTLFGFFNAPLFATFILGMFWKRMTATAGWTGLVSGTIAAVLLSIASTGVLGSLSQGWIGLSGQGASFVAAGAAFVVDIVVSVLVTAVTQPKPDSELRGLVYSLTPKKDFHDANEGSLAWYQQPTKLAAVGAVLVIILNILFW